MTVGAESGPAARGPDDASVFDVPWGAAAEAPDAPARAWDLAIAGNVATCTGCYLALLDAAGGVYAETLSAALEGGKRFLFARYDPNTAALALEAGWQMLPEGWPETDTALVRVLLYELEQSGGAWGVKRDMRGAPIVGAYR